MADFGRSEAIQAEENPKSPAEAVDELKRTVTVDTLHTDEALKVLANYNGDETWTEKEEKKVQRKIDRRLLPILCATYGLQVSTRLNKTENVESSQEDYC
jgi:pyrroloquinoline quinone (PQQ) biosynthesis protein C